MKRRGFTLIELLIVVAIIAILAAIAVPNFLEAQVRAKVSRCKNDMRSIAVGVESYQVDNNSYPINAALPATFGFTYMDQWTEFLNTLSTPIAYMSSMQQKDPFAPPRPDFTPYGYTGPFVGSFFWVDYSTKNGMRSWGGAMKSYYPTWNVPERQAYIIYSWGPNRKTDSIEWAIIGGVQGSYTITSNGAGSYYDPTNGSVSAGDIGRWGGDAPMTTTP